MKVFISWSGERSHALAVALYEWIPEVIQSIEPWLSSANVDAGARWEADIATQLNASSFGLICLTKENLDARWILFEAGALSKSLENSRVCPVLLDLSPTDLALPLAQFNAVRCHKTDMLRLLKSLNATLGEGALPETRLLSSFERCWSDFAKRVEQIMAVPNALPTSNPRDQGEILDEVLSLVRTLARSDNRRSALEESLLQARPDFITDIDPLDDAEGHQNTIVSRRKRRITRHMTQAPASGHPSFTLTRVATMDGRVSDPVTKEDIASAMVAQGYIVSPADVALEKPIDILGVTRCSVQTDSDVVQEVIIWVLADESSVLEPPQR